MANEGEFPKQDGDVLYASEVNAIAGIHSQVDTTTDLDAWASAGTTDTATKEYTFTSSELASANYLEIKTNFNFYGPGDANRYVSVKIETKEIGSTYSESMPEKKIQQYDANINLHIDTYTLWWIHTLTSGEKANGCVVKVTFYADASGGGSDCRITNNALMITPK